MASASSQGGERLTCYSLNIDFARLQRTDSLFASPTRMDLLETSHIGRCNLQHHNPSKVSC